MTAREDRGGAPGRRPLFHPRFRHGPHMIGQTIEARISFPINIILCGLLAAGLCLLAAALSLWDLALLSAWPWLAALLLLVRWARQKPFRATFTATALEVEEPPLSLPYDQVQGLLAGRRPINPYQVGPRTYPIQVIHPEGVVRIPPQLNVRSDEIYSFLYQRLSGGGTAEVHPSLVPYLRYKQQEYGPARVWSYRARRYRGHGPEYPLITALCGAAALAGMGWLLFGLVQEAPAWIGASIPAVLLGGLFSLLSGLSGRLTAVPEVLRESCLVICPDGLALVQADLQGQLRWEEVRDVQVKKRATLATNNFQLAAVQPGPGIVLKVAGAVIVLLDVFDRPLPLIHQLFCHYWRGDADRQETVTDWHFDATLLNAAGSYWTTSGRRKQ